MSTSEVPPLYRSSSTTGFCVSIKKHDKNREHFGGSSCLLSYLRSPTLRNAFWHWHTWAKALHKASSLVVAFGNWKERNRARMSYDNGIKELSRIWASGKRNQHPRKVLEETWVAREVGERTFWAFFKFHRAFAYQRNKFTTLFI